MGDIKVTLQGDSTGAQNAFHDVGGVLEEFSAQIGKSVEVAHLLEVGLEKIKEGIQEFVSESISLYGKQEQAIVQLTHAAGENAGAFIEQAEAMKEHLGVSAESVMKMQQLALQFGTLPTSVEGATGAILDWSAATGGSAEGGMMALARAVDFGQGKVKSLGIEFTVTGDKAKDMENAIAALNSKFGGSADVMGDTLIGRMNKAKEGGEDLKRSFGSFFDMVDTKLHVIDAARLAFKGWALELKALTPGSGVSMLGSLGGGDESAEPKPVTNPGQVNGGIAGVHLTQPDAVKAIAAEGAAKVKAELTAQQQIDAVYDAEDLREENRALKNDNASKASWEKYYADIMEEQKKGQQGVEALAQKRQEEEQAEADKEDKARAAEDEKQEKALENHLKKLQATADAQNKKFTTMMTEAGWRVGTAFVEQLNTALEQAASGGPVDSGKVAAEVVEGLVVSILSLVADYFGGAGAGQLVGALGQLGSTAINTAVFKKHDGGWIEPPRFHGGGWPGLGTDEQHIIAKRGERILSPPEVGRMGGPAGVDAAARGGGGGHVTVQAFDSQSLLQMFQGRGGRAVYNTIRSGQGMLLPLFR